MLDTVLKHTRHHALQHTVNMVALLSWCFATKMGIAIALHMVWSNDVKTMKGKYHSCCRLQFFVFFSL